MSSGSESSAEFNRRMKSLNEAANTYLENRGFEVSQKNGQRISVLRNHLGPIDTGRSEVFVGKLPRDLFENELLPFMQLAGQVQKIRLMMDFSGTNRGFAFIKYMSPNEAEAACNLLNQATIRFDAPPVGVLLSFDNKRLYFGNLPPRINKEQLLRGLKETLNDIEEVSLPSSDSRCDKRFAFVTFKTHEAATIARRILLPGDVKMFGRTITVDWAKPDQSNMNNNNNNNNVRMPLPEAPPVLPLQNLINFDWTKPDLNNNNMKVPTLEPTVPLYNQDCVITICNINTICVTLDKLRRIFELAGKLKIVDIRFSGLDSLTIAYESSEHADLMLEAIVLLPSCFQRVALPNTILAAYKGPPFIAYNNNNNSNHNIIINNNNNIANPTECSKLLSWR